MAQTNEELEKQKSSKVKQNGITDIAAYGNHTTTVLEHTATRQLQFCSIRQLHNYSVAAYSN